MIVYPTTAKTTNGAFPENAGKLVDDWLRRELRVGDPRDPGEVSRALTTRYPGEAVKLDEESRGLSVPLGGPVWQMPAEQAAAVQSPGSRELDDVQRDLDSDSTRLATSSAVRDWVPEMGGWKLALLREVSEGADAARYAQDAASRDRAFLSARRLSHYARVARLIGTRNAEAMFDFRRLATTLDEAAFAIRILMGEALYQAGLIAGGFIIQVPLTDARQRREGVMNALQQLVGTAPVELGFGNGAYSYGALLRRLENNGESDLRVYLREAQLAQAMDDLLGAAGRQSPGALRGLSATAPVELERLELLLRIAASMQPPASSELSAFVQALSLFLSAFTNTRSGSRLIDLAVPLPMAARETNGVDGPGRTLLRNLVSFRARFAQEVECFQNCCACSDPTRRLQERLDRALGMTDRAIDLVAQGGGRPPAWAPDELQGAMLISFLHAFANNVILLRDRSGIPGLVRASVRADMLLAPLVALAGNAAALRALRLRVRVWQHREDRTWRDLAAQLSPRCAKFP